METEQGLQLSDYLAAVRRRRHLLVLIALPVALIGLVFAVALPDVYMSSAVVDIEEAKVGGFLNKAGSQIEGENYADQYVYSLADRVLTSSNLRELIVKRKLYPEFADDIDRSVEEIRNGADVEVVTTTILDPNNGRQREVVTAFKLTFSSDSPERAKQLATELAEAILQADRDNRQQRAADSARFFEAESEKFRVQISQLESRLADFKEQNYGRLPELANVNMNALDRVERELENVRMQMQTLSQNRIFLAQQLQEARVATPNTNLLRELEDEFRRKSNTYDQNHPDLVSLRRQIEQLKMGVPIATGNSLQAQLEQQRAVLRQAQQRYSEDHPDVKAIKREIDNLQARIAAGEKVPAAVESSATVVQLQTQINALDTQAAALQAREIELRTKLAEVEGRLEATPQVERDYQLLTRDLTLARGKYEQMLDRQLDAEVTQAAIASGSADEFHMIQLPSLPSEPAAPPRMAIAIVSVFLALMLSFSAAVASEIFDSTVRSSRDLRSMFGVAPLAMIPEVRNSVTQRRHKLRLATLAASVLAGVPMLYLAVSLLT